jgi:hypothetical protein
VQVLTPGLSLHGRLGEGVLWSPAGVCANTDVVVVCEPDDNRVSVFSRGDGALLRRFGCEGSGDGELRFPTSLRFVHGDRRVAVADLENDRVSVFSVDGEFVRHVGVGLLNGPLSVVCTPCDELVVADSENRCVRVFSDTGELLMTFGDDDFQGVALLGNTVLAQAAQGSRCVVFVQRCAQASQQWLWTRVGVTIRSCDQCDMTPQPSDSSHALARPCAPAAPAARRRQHVKHARLFD